MQKLHTLRLKKVCQAHFSSLQSGNNYVDTKVASLFIGADLIVQLQHKNVNLISYQRKQKSSRQVINGEHQLYQESSNSSSCECACLLPNIKQSFGKMEPFPAVFIPTDAGIRLKSSHRCHFFRPMAGEYRYRVLVNVCLIICQ